MAVSYRTEGFVFKKENRQEADKVFTVFTRDFGRVEIFAKSIRAIASKLKGGIEIFSVSELEFIQGKNRKTLTDARLLEKCTAVLSSPEKIEIAYKVSDTLDIFIKGPQIDEKVWALIMDTFGKLQDSKTNNKFLYYYFFWNFASILGYSPELHGCANCNQKLQPRGLYFSSLEGGIICANCGIVKKGGIKVTDDTVKILRLIIGKEWQMLSKLKIGLQAKKLLKEVSTDYKTHLMQTYDI